MKIQASKYHVQKFILAHDKNNIQNKEYLMEISLSHKKTIPTSKIQPLLKYFLYNLPEIFSTTSNERIYVPIIFFEFMYF